MSKTKANKIVQLPPPTRYEVECFHNPGYRVTDLKVSFQEPSCFNGYVNVHKWRVVAEIVPEPVEVIRARIVKLWKETKNHHDWNPLQAAAQRVGIKLTSGYGDKRGFELIDPNEKTT